MVKRDTCNIAVAFQALEINIPQDPSGSRAQSYLSLVFKRGKQQRSETEKILYADLDQNNYQML